MNELGGVTVRASGLVAYPVYDEKTITLPSGMRVLSQVSHSRT